MSQSTSSRTKRNLVLAVAIGLSVTMIAVVIVRGKNRI